MKFQVTVPSVALTFQKKLMRRILQQAGTEVARTARALIGRLAGGRRYGAHSASAPGQPPMSLSGLLARSIKVTVRDERVSIRDTAFYAKFLESGAQGGGGGKGNKNQGRSHKRGGAKGTPSTQRVMLPRPFLSTAADEEMPLLGKRIQQALSQGIDLKIIKPRP